MIVDIPGSNTVQKLINKICVNRKYPDKERVYKSLNIQPNTCTKLVYLFKAAGPVINYYTFHILFCSILFLVFGHSVSRAIGVLYPIKNPKRNFAHSMPKLTPQPCKSKT